jgi:hypothetical protein
MKGSSSPAPPTSPSALSRSPSVISLGSSNEVMAQPDPAVASSVASLPPSALKGIMASIYAQQKRRLMDLVNQIRSTGTSLDIECVCRYVGIATLPHLWIQN